MKKLNILLIGTLIFIPFKVSAFNKSETIYSNLNYDGSSYNTIINNQLKNVNEKELEDETELKNILNINGNEKFELKNNKLLWKTNKKDIFYRGTLEKKLPISTDIKYYLNGKKVNPDDIVGKSGSISIVIDFTNHEKNTVNINGINQNLYTPFVVTLGTIIDGKDNKNININNGKVVSTGSRNMVVGLSSPGLYESINYDGFKTLNNITIEYETTNFSLNNIYIVSTPKLIDDNDLDIFKKMDNLYNNISLLKENMDKIEDGAKKLQNGTKTLSNGSSLISENLQIASKGIIELENGSNDINNGIKQVIDALNLAKSQLNIDKLNMLEQNNINAANGLLVSLKSLGLTDDLIILFNSFTVKDLNLGGTFNSNDEANNGLKNYLQTNGYNTTQIQSIMQLKSLYDVYLLLGMDASIFNQISNLSNQIDQLLIGLNNLKDGSTNLTNGIKSLKEGISKLYSGSLNLNEGIKNLDNGTITLSNGIVSFNKQGISTLTHYAYTIKDYSDKADALINLSKNYKGFASNNSNTTNFISMIKATKKK